MSLSTPASTARARESLERRLAPLRDVSPLAARPSGGWIRAIREALGMTTEDLAARMHVTQSSVTRLEHSEKARTARLETLARAAEAMDCEVVYALVPRRPLDELVNEQANQVAMTRLRRLEHTMALEEQEPDHDRLHRSFDLFRDAALRSPGLWHPTATLDNADAPPGLPSAPEPR